MSSTPEKPSSPLDWISNVSDACASGDPAALFAAVDGCVHHALRQALCTVNRYDPATDRLTRLYSSDPVSYPVGGSKDKAGTAWGRMVLHDKRLFVGEGVDAIRESFDDHETIRSLGLRSVINVPVVARDRCLGTFNVLMTGATVDTEKVHWARLAGLLVLPGFLMTP